MTSDNLDSLSDEDLRAIADRMGLGLPTDLERIFVVEEILDALEEDGIERDRGSESPLYFEDAKYWCRDDSTIEVEKPRRLEPRYNETMVKAIVRDPSWAFALWDISESDRQAYELDAGEAQVLLRVTETSLKEAERSVFFDIPVSSDDLQWYINLPHPEARYRIDLAVKSGSRTKVLARSGEIMVPSQYFDGAVLSPKARKLLELSGLHELEIEVPIEENSSRILRSGT